MEDNIISEIMEIIIEDFYLLDTDFNPDNCNIVFREIYNCFVADNKEAQARIELFRFAKKVMGTVDIKNEYDYKLFLNNINLLPFSYFKKQKIISNVENQVKTKKRS